MKLISRTMKVEIKVTGNYWMNQCGYDLSKKDEWCPFLIIQPDCEAYCTLFKIELYKSTFQPDAPEKAHVTLPPKRVDYVRRCEACTKKFGKK